MVKLPFLTKSKKERASNKSTTTFSETHDEKQQTKQSQRWQHITSNFFSPECRKVELSQRLGGSSPKLLFLSARRNVFSSWQTMIVTLRKSPCLTRPLELTEYWSKYKFGAVDSKALLASSVLAPVFRARLTGTNRNKKNPWKLLWCRSTNNRFVFLISRPFAFW